MGDKYVISLAVNGVEITPGFYGWLLMREGDRVSRLSGDGRSFLRRRDAFFDGVQFGSASSALRFPTIDDAVEAVRDVDESGQVRVCW